MAEEPKNTSREEKLGFLKREEVRTMAKDIAKLRKAESEAERRRIADLKVEQRRPVPAPTTEEQAAEQIRSSLAPEEETPAIVAPRPPSQRQKRIVRVIVAAILFVVLVNVGLFLFWYFTRRDVETPVPVAPQEQTPPTAPQPQEPAPTPPSPLLEGQSSVFLSSLTTLSEFVAGAQTPGITTIRTNEDTPALLFAELGVTDTQGIAPLLSQLEVFVFEGEQRRIGLIAEQTSSLQDRLSLWEATLEADTADLFSLMGSRGAGYTDQFRSTTVNGVAVRFQTLSTSDFGIVYAVIGDLFVLTGSLESMQAVINRI